MARPLLGRDRFACGDPRPMAVLISTAYGDTLFDLLSAYGALRRRDEQSTLQILPTELFSMQQALERVDRDAGPAAGGPR